MPVVRKYKCEVVSVEKQAENIFTAEFCSLDGKFRYLPGQFLHLALDEYDPSEAWPDSRCFSIQTSPVEKNLKITYSVKGTFTVAMAETLKPGKQVWLKLPYGELFAKDHSKENTVFISGGTGITPFLSLFTDPSFAEYKNPKLYAGFRTKSLDIYGKELEIALGFCPALIAKKYYDDRDGKINIEKVFSENGTGSDYFISGPPAMIKTFSEYLKNKGVPESGILSDDWE
jgi:ferredoxin-NADP reductase